jgi:hypothetical protein
VKLLDARGEPIEAPQGGDVLTVRVQAHFDKDVDDPVVGILVRNRLGVDVYGTNSRIEEKSLGSFHAGDTLEIDFRFDCLLTRQEYTLTVATQHSNGASMDWLDDVRGFTVVEPKDLAGVVNLRSAIEWRRI